MKPLTYYETNEIPYPKKEDYITLYIYDKGECIDNCSCFDTSREELKKKYPGAVIQEVLDNEAFMERLKEYNLEDSKLDQEFQNDLFEDYGVSDNPKRFKCFELAWERVHSSGLGGVYGRFGDLVELIR